MNRPSDFYILMLGRFISQTGSYFNLIAINLFILIKTGSPTITGLSMAVRILTACAFSPYLGSLADRMDRRRGMIMSDLLLGAAMLLLAMAPDSSIIALIFAVQIALGIFSNFFMINFQAALPNFAPKGDLLKANSWFQAVNCATIAVGALTAALAIDLIGYRGAFVLDGISYFISLAILVALPIVTSTAPRTKAKENVPAEGFVNGLKGLSKASPFIFFIFFIRLLDGVGSGSHNIAMPVFSEMVDRVSPGNVYGFILFAWAFGSALSVLFLNLTSFGKKMCLESTFIYATILMSVFWIITFQSFDRTFFITAAFIAGVFDSAASVSYSMLLHRTDDAVRGRVMGMSAITMTAGFGGGMAVSSVMAGYISPALLVAIWHGIPLVFIAVFAFKKRSVMFSTGVALNAD